jgi:hypothetical protein
MSTAALAVAMTLGTSSTAFASFPMGVWTRVTKMVFEPNEQSPTKVQIHGAFMFWTGSSYGPVANGFTYYECKGKNGPATPDELKTCSTEWQDLKKNVGNMDDPSSGKYCLGYGAQNLPTGKLRKPGDPVENPDAWPFAMGVKGGFTPCQTIQQFLAQQGSGGMGGMGGGGAVGPGPTGATATSAATTSGAGGSTGSSGATTGGQTTGGSNTAPPAPEAKSGCAIALAPTRDVAGLVLAALAAAAWGRRRRAVR